MKLTLLGFVCAAGLALGQVRPIHDIQGPDETSPRLGQAVTTEGIVTARKGNGFFIQASEREYDSNPGTSEGIFVFTSTAPAANVQPGARVRVTGPVAEFRPAAQPNLPTLTQIARPTAIEVESTGNLLPEAMELSREHFLAGWGWNNVERFEGMRVRIPQLQVTGPTLAAAAGVLYGVIPGMPRPQQSPFFDGAPERIRVETASQPGAGRLDLVDGQRIGPFTGPLDFNFAWTVIQDPGLITLPVLPRAATPLPRPTADEYTVATINLERLFDEVDDPGIGETVAPKEQFEARLRKVSRALREILRAPDVIAVQEVENQRTLDLLAAQIQRDDPALDYQGFTVPGNDPGGINVGFLVRAGRLVGLRLAQEGKDDQYTRPDGRAELLNDRPPLVLWLRTPDDGRLAVISNHWRSRVDLDDPVAGPRIRLKRQLQAEYTRTLIERLEREDPQLRIVVAGDFNSFQFEDETIGALTRRGLMTNIGQYLHPSLSTSYIFDGTAQTLDHVFVNRALRPFYSRVFYTRMNAAYPEMLARDYDRPERISDHEAAMAYFTAAPQRLTPAMIALFGGGVGGFVTPGAGAIISIALRQRPASLSIDGVDVPNFAWSPDWVQFQTPATLRPGALATIRIDGLNPVMVPVVESAPVISAIAPVRCQGGSCEYSLDLFGSGVREADLGVSVNGLWTQVRLTPNSFGWLVSFTAPSEPRLGARTPVAVTVNGVTSNLAPERPRP